MNPISYNQYMGKVVLMIPVIGGVAQTLTTGSGKLVLFSFIGLILLLEIVGNIIQKRHD